MSRLLKLTELLALNKVIEKNKNFAECFLLFFCS